LGTRQYRLRTLTVLIDLVDQLVKDLPVEGLTHKTEDIGHHFGGDTAGLLVVEAVECLLQNGNLLGGQVFVLRRKFHEFPYITSFVIR